MLDIQAIENEIANLKTSQEAGRATDYLRDLIEKYELRNQALEKELETIKQRIESTDDTLRSMRTVLLVTESAQGDKPESRFTDAMPAWECAMIILEEESRPLTSREIADRIEAGGKALGEQSAAKVTSGLSRHLGTKFSRKEAGGLFFYSLNKWAEDKMERKSG